MLRLINSVLIFLLSVFYRFTHLSLDRIRVTIGSVGSTFITVLYAATLEGVIHKLAVFPADSGVFPDGSRTGDGTDRPLVCLVEAISVSEKPRPGLVRSLQLHTAKVGLCLRWPTF